MKARYSTLQLVDHPNGVLEIRLQRPDVRNAFNAQMIQDFTHLFMSLRTQEGIRIAILSGEGPVFCAGGDLQWMKQSVEMSHAENLEETRRLSRMFDLMNTFPKPLIGKIHGAAIGGGVGLVSVCDVVFATEDTQFSLSEVRLGIVPACIGPFVISKIGLSSARRFFLSAERFSAGEAARVGLVHRVLPGKEELDTAVSQMVQNILLASPQALRTAKDLVLQLGWPENRARHSDYLEWISQVLADLRVSPEGQEGLKAFLEKRKPNWSERKF